MNMLAGNISASDRCAEPLGAGRIRELDGWRAVAASMVVAGHFLTGRYPQSLSRIPGIEWVVRDSASLGVQIFFVISGFVICRLLLLEELRYGSFSLKHFYYRRICRILPPFYLYLATLLVLSSVGWIHLSHRNIASAGLFLYDFHSWWRPWFTGHSWSLAVEEQFYLIFPAVLMLTPRRWRVAVCAAIGVCCILWTFSMVFTGWESLISSSVRAGFACISCGVIVAMLEAPARALARRVPAAIVAVLACLLILHPVGANNWKAALYESGFVPPAIALILLFSCERGAALRSFLCSRPVQAVGLTSYGLYLWQQLFTGKPELYIGPGRIIPYLLPLVCVIVPASYLLIEKPAMRYGKLLSRREEINTQSLSVGV